MAVIRRASRRDAETPVLAACDWVERVAEPTTPRPPKPGELCHHCQHYLDACVCDKPQTRPTGPNPKNSVWAEKAREALADIAAARTKHTPPEEET